ncbi:MAG TPA: cell wall-binding repeat-containing protein [Acidothermaceae bacterium]|jgi:hypothetical protein
MRPIVVNEVADSGAPHRDNGGFVRRSHRAGVALAAVSGLILTLAINVSAAASAGTGDTPVGSAPVVPVGAQVQGVAPAAQPISFDVVLRPRNQAALNAFTTAVSSPSSPEYRQFLTSAEYASEFGPTPSTIASVSGRLRSLGLTVGAVQGSLLPVSGSVTKVGSALHTSFRQYRLASGRTARANVVAPQVPTDVVGAVQAIVGLDTLTQLTPAVSALSAPSHDLLGSGTPAPALNANLTGPSACSAAAAPPAYTAPQVASYYGLTSLYSGGTLGSGVTVAIAELEPYTVSDIDAYQSCYGTGTTVTPISIDGGPTGSQSGEAALDIEDVIGLAPSSTIDVYQAPNSLTSVLHMYQQIATDNTAQVVSTSWGQCEARDTSNFLNAENTIFQQMATQGQTMLAASGDAGSSDCDNPLGGSTALAVDDPASQPYVTGVGGTDLQSTSGPESTWNEGTVNGGLSAGGGGISTAWQMPSWQTALAVTSGNVGTICGQSAASMCREVPDVSASAQPSNGYRIFFTSNGTSRWFTIGGTSAAAPTWAALIALADASTSCNGHRLGFLNPALYQLRAAWPADFHDVTSGNNDAIGANGGKYVAGPGYDMATGLGTPVGANLTGDLCSDGSGTITADQTAINASTRTTLHFTYTAAAGHNLTAGQIDIAVPAGWSTPSTASNSAGYTTASPGTVSISSNTIQVSGLTIASGSTVTITYGDTSGTGGGALSPNAAQTAVFATTQKGLNSGTLTALASSPQVLVGGPDGSGTLTVSPSTIAPSTLTTLTFTYSPATNTSLAAGTVAITVPVGGTTGWTQPNTTPSTAGYVTVSTGSVSVSGSTIRVDSVTIPVGGSLTVTYGSGSGGAVTSPSATTTTSFAAQERNTSSGTLSALTPSPSVFVGTGGGSSGGGGGGAGPAAQTLTLARIAGADRIATSIAASQAGFPTTHSAAAVVLARSDTFADALAGTPLAVGKHGPLLLTGSASLSSATSAEIERVLAPGATVYVLGGISAVTPAVANAVAALGHPVLRISGPDRFATAAQVAAALGNPNIVFEADGTNFPDALSAGSAAAAAGGVVLLTAGSGQSGPTAAYLSAHPSATRYAIGGPAAHADPSAQPFVGSDRFATSVLVAQAFFPKPASVGLASGLAFPDALSGGSVAAMNHGPVVLVPSNGALPSSVASYLASAQASAASAWLFGGTSSVGADIFNAAAAILAPAT